MRFFDLSSRAVVALAALAIPAMPLVAQEMAVKVTVTDITGAVIPGASIFADSLGTGAETTQKAGPDGSAVLDLEPGAYKLDVTAKGFGKWEKQIDVRTGVSESIAAELNIAATAIYDLVISTGPEIDIEQPGITALIPYTIPARMFVLHTSFKPRRGSSTTVAKEPEIPDLVLYHGTILTGEGLKEGSPRIVSAIAILNGKVLFAGSDDVIKAIAGPKTQLRDLHGAFVMPGLNDAHLHLGGAGRTKLNVDLTGCKSLQEMLDRVKAKANESPAGHWLSGGGWDHTLWASKTLPTRQDLDKVTGGHPAFFERIDGHIAVANSAALAAAGITGRSVAPQGGAIDLDAAGEPTGILRDTEMEAAGKMIPPPTAEDRRRGLELAIADASSHGLTSVQDNSEWDDFLVYEQLEKEGKLTVRISEWLPFDAPMTELHDHSLYRDPHDPMLHTGMLKGFMDGSLGSRTAALKAPYADEPGNSGLARYDQEKLNKMAIERSKAGFQIGFHAIGDRAAAMALDAFSQSYNVCFEPQPAGSKCRYFVAENKRDRIEHAQVVDPADIPRFARLGVVASMQPNHLLTDMNWAMDRLGPKRAAYSYAWKAFLDAGVVVAFGTDYPVEPVTPFRGLYAAVTRANEAGTKTYFPESALTRAQALYAYTQGSAYAEFAENSKGKLVPGYDADLILLDRNLLTCPAAEILGTKVLETVVGGKTVYRAAP